MSAVYMLFKRLHKKIKFANKFNDIISNKNFAKRICDWNC